MSASQVVDSRGELRVGIMLGVVLIIVGIVGFVLARRRRRRSIETSGGDVGSNVLEVLAIAVFVGGMTSAAFSIHH